MNLAKINTILTITILFSIMFFVNNANAERISTCQWTNDNHFCVESTDDTFSSYGGCKEGYKNTFQTRDQVPQCSTGTCVPKASGQCLSNKYKIECERANTGVWYDQPLRSVEACQLGCCNVADSLCAIKEKKVCVQDLANGDNNAFTSGITDQNTCDNSCRTADVGCCVQGSSYSWKTRASCGNGQFYNDIQCRDVPGYPAVTQKYKSCGQNTNIYNADFDVYYYDSNNNMEDIAEQCNNPGEPITKKCFDPDGLGGKDAYCQSTNCVDDCPDCDKTQLKTGESICLNTLNTFYGNDKKSTGLDNYILRCQYGVVSPDNSDNNRELRCQETITNERTTAKFVENKYSGCLNCGKADGLSIDSLSYVPVIGPPTSAGLLFGLGEVCIPVNEPGWTWGLGQRCENYGDCSYDKDFIWAPIGSCNPKYPPSNTDKCGECGKGGDAGTNLCTRNECNALGDCQFNKKTVSSEALAASGGLALGFCGGAVFVSQVVCNIPIFGQAGCPGALSGASGICTSFGGKDAMIWGLQGLVYGIGANAATADNYEPDQDVLVNGKIKLSVAIATANGVLQNLSNYNVSLGTGLTSPSSGRDVPTSVATSTLSGVTAYSASAIQILAAGGSLALDNAVKNNIIGSKIVGFVDKLFIDRALGIITPGLILISTAPSFETGTCTAETPNTNNNQCSLCGSGEAQWYCTEERCNILGGANGLCQYVKTQDSTGKAYGKCLPKDPTDKSDPTTNKIEVIFMDNNRNVVVGPLSKESKIYEVQEKINWKTYMIGINITTNEKSTCSYSRLLGTEYNGPNSILFGEELPSLYHYEEFNLTESDKVNGIKLYFKCKDLNGNTPDKTDDSSYLSLAFEERPDEYPPQIQYIDPMPTKPIPKDITNVDMTMIVYDGENVNNDVQECKYTKTNSSNYADYENTFSRDEIVNCVTTNSNNCRKFSTNIDLTSFGTQVILNETTSSTAYQLRILCKDTSGNLMNEPQDWLLVSKETFSVTINKPLENEQIYERTIIVNASTTDAAVCNYTLAGNEYILSKDPKFEHVTRTTFNLSDGAYNLVVSCRDIAGNVPSSSVSFNIVSDNNAPNLIRLYKSSDQLCLQLNEKAQCKYTNKATSNIFDEGNLMIDRNSNTYCSRLEDKTYYVACRDVWDNEMTATIYP